ncbi:hypothetical protein BJ138DRAFT_1119940 [Hygrophoropsis aurantiaca]|uniref:Uncharacterized protein n=1 Tax=Hygrophoropsis aurantiaca TaxID=72124 RepID=A0ACB7ZSQ7_9AGAM|nr:hypothetical protein BJ138DRAFT_1119940 [Hygrophoropsis aurantiaca]
MSQQTPIRRMTTRSKNANQRPGLIDLNPPSLGTSEPASKPRRTKAQKTLDDEKKADDTRQAEEDAAEALIAIKQGYARVAVLEEKMKVREANQKADAPKPPRPKTSKKPASYSGDGEAAAVESEADGTLISDEEELAKPANGKALKGKGKKVRAPPKPLKTAVRDAISAVHTKAVDKISHVPRDKSTEADLAVPPVSKKNEISGRIQNWTAGVDLTPDATPKPKQARVSGFSSTVHSTLVGSTPKTSLLGLSIAKSTLSSGISVSSKSGPIRALTLANTAKVSSAPETTSNPMVGNGSPFDANEDEDEDNEDDALAEELERQAALIRAKKQQRKMGLVQIKIELPDTSINQRSEEPCENDKAQSQSVDEDHDFDMDDLETQNTTRTGHAEDQDVAMPSADEDFELTPPPSTQPRAMHYSSTKSPTVNLKRKRISDPIDSSDSEIEIIDGPSKQPAIKLEKTEQQSVRQTSTKTATIKLKSGTASKLPVAKRVKLEKVSELSAPVHAPSPLTGERILPRSQYRHEHLPKGVNFGGRWKKTFIPTVILYLGGLAECWPSNEDALVAALQTIFNAVYDGILEHTVTTEGAVFAVTLQRLCTWRNSMASAAIAALAHLMVAQSDIETDEDRQFFATEYRKKFAFVYEDIEDENNYSGAFKSEIIVQTVAQHIFMTLGAINVPSLKTKLTEAKGAIILATVAVERALHLFIDGDIEISNIALLSKGLAKVKIPAKTNKETGARESTTTLAFSDDNWGAKAKNYMKALTERHPAAISDTTERARAIAKARRQRSSLAADDNEDNGDASTEDERVFL